MSSTLNIGPDGHPSSRLSQPSAQSSDTTEFLFYCDMLALGPDERRSHLNVIARLFGSLLQETRELADGYAYRFDGEHYRVVAEFIVNERRCCPFLTFHLTVAPESGPLWLELTGPSGVKPFLREELGHFVAQL